MYPAPMFQLKYYVAISHNRFLCFRWILSEKDSHCYLQESELNVYNLKVILQVIHHLLPIYFSQGFLFFNHDFEVRLVPIRKLIALHNGPKKSSSNVVWITSNNFVSHNNMNLIQYATFTYKVPSLYCMYK